MSGLEVCPTCSYARLPELPQKTSQNALFALEELLPGPPRREPVVLALRLLCDNSPNVFPNTYRCCCVVLFLAVKLLVLPLTNRALCFKHVEKKLLRRYSVREPSTTFASP